jgi:hypothetical protein
VLFRSNDSEDEAVFEFLKSDKKCKQYFQQDCQKYICVLEKKPSEADFYIEERDTVRPLLQKFQNATQYRKKNRSYADLNALTSDIRPLGGDKKMKTKNVLLKLRTYLEKMNLKRLLLSLLDNRERAFIYLTND